MQSPLRSLEQLAPFATAGELVAKKPEPVVSCTPNATLVEAMQVMKEKGAGLLLILEGETLAGVISERDCARGAVLRSLDPRTTRVREIMCADVHVASPQMKIPECIMLMHDKGIGHLPVVDGKRVQGVLSVRDLMGALIERHERLLRRLNEERLTLLYSDPSSY
jgi:CBS domain-containing protein